MLSQREAFARTCEHLCQHDGYPGHGYSQISRLGDGTSETIDLGDGVTVEIAGGDRDCSSMVVTALKAVGVDVRGASYTGNLLNICNTGLFKAHRRSNGACVDGYSARRGDIYLNVTHHTAVCRYGAYEEGGDTLMQFSGSEHGTIDGAEGDQTGRESNIKPYYDYPWDYTLSWTSDGAMIGEETEEDEEEDDMTEIVINIPQSDDMAANIMVYVCGDQVHDIADPEALRILQQVYSAAHGGKEIPTMELSGSREKPEFQRFLQAIRGGIPSTSIFPAVDMLVGRSEERSDGNDGTE